MSARDAFAEKFRLLLREIPENYTLPQWQFLYRQVIFSMGMRILERFPNDAAGPDPFNKSGGGAHPPPPPPPSPLGGGKGGGAQPATKGGGQGGGAQPDTKGGGQGGGGQPAFVKFVLGLQEEVIVPPAPK